MASTGPLRLIQEASLPGVAGEGTAMVVMTVSSRHGPRTAGRTKGARTQDQLLHERKAKRAFGRASISPASGELRVGTALGGLRGESKRCARFWPTCGLRRVRDPTADNRWYSTRSAA